MSTIVFIRDVASYILRPLDSLFARAGLIDGSINDSLPARPTLVEVICLLGLWSGATIVVMPKFELDTYLELVERHRATLLHVVPPVVVALAKHPTIVRRDFSSIRKLFSGAAPLGADAIEQCTRRLGCVLQQGYGLTETSPAAHVTPADPARIKYGSIGRTVPNTECRVVDPATGADLAPGEEGEIWLRGPQVVKGYFKRPEDTRRTLDDEGWLHTGDIGHADADGDFFIVDRLKELIKYKGMQVPPAELEAVLLSHPSVADAAVVPLKDDDAGEIPRAFVVLRAPASAPELMEYVAQRVAPLRRSGGSSSSTPYRSPHRERSCGGCCGMSR